MKTGAPVATSYIFQSARLGFRNWVDADMEKLAAMNADAEVMEFFPTTISAEETAAFVKRMQQQYAEKVYCYFAVDILENGNFIGFIGLSDKTFPAHFTPCVDIGWRLAREAWNKGYATEGAVRCLDYAFHTLQLSTVYSMAPAANKKSEGIMKKIGMKRVGEFMHPALVGDDRLQNCVLYRKDRPVNKQL